MKRVNRERSRAWLLRWSGSRSAVLASASLGRTSKILYILLGGGRIGRGREGYGGEELGPSPNAPLGRAREPCAAAVACGQPFFLSGKSSERGCLSVLLPSLVAAMPASTAAGRRRRLSAGRKEAGPSLLLAPLFFAALRWGARLARCFLAPAEPLALRYGAQWSSRLSSR